MVLSTLGSAAQRPNSAAVLGLLFVLVAIGKIECFESRRKLRQSVSSTAGYSIRTTIRPRCFSAETATPPGKATSWRSKRSGEWRWTFFLGRLAWLFGLCSTLSPLVVAYWDEPGGTDYMLGAVGGGGKPSEPFARKYLCDRGLGCSSRVIVRLIQKPRSAWPKENRSRAQPQR